MSRRVRLQISYDGTAYDGWQRQPHGVPTVQATVEHALERLFGEKIKIVGASRTDTGVHAFCQNAHFDCPKDPTLFKDFCYSLQSLLPADIVIKKAWVAPEDFDASRDAVSKIYRYLIYNSARPSALRRRQAVWIRRPLNLDWLNEASGHLLGRHDFASFKNAGSTTKTTEREIESATWIRRPGGIIEFRIQGKGFLKQMVRNIVGTLLELERLNANPLEIKRILESCDRKSAGATAPAHGLYLQRIFYPEDLDKRCRKL